jgi:glycosidase
MQWNNATNAGFSTGKPYRRVNTNYPSVNVETENADPASLLNHYRKIITVRNASPALSTGEYRGIRSGDPRVGAFLRFTKDETVLVIVNYGSSAKDVSLETGGSFNTAADLLLPGSAAISVQSGKIDVTGIPPVSARIYRLK